jgi:fluoroquinolone resistance protein
MPDNLTQPQLDDAVAGGRLDDAMVEATLLWPETSTALLAQGCRFTGVDFRNRDLNGAQFLACTFIDCSFRSAELNEGRFERCRFYDTERETACDFSFATLRHACLDGCDLTTAICRRVRAFGIELTRCQAAGIDFSDSDFGLGVGDAVAASFVDCNLAYADFSRTALNGSNFSGSRLSHSIWHDADLAGADLTRCRLDNIEARGLTLRGADLRGAQFNQLDPRQIDLTHVRMFADQGLIVLRTLGLEID